MKPKLSTVSSEDFLSICATSSSVAQIIRRAGMTVCSSAYRSVRKKVALEKIDLSHIQRGLASNRGKPSFNRKPLEHHLKGGDRKRIKAALLREGVLGNHCSICSLPSEWNGKTLVMRLDHISGDPLDNSLENLRLVCPNCDSQLPTFAGRNRRGRRRCVDCLEPVSKRATRCSRCDGHFRRGSQPTKISWPSVETLFHQVQQSGYTAIARQLGVSDNAVRKRLKTYQN